MLLFICLAVNATNRLSVLFGSLLAMLKSHTGTVLDWHAAARVVLPVAIGSTVVVVAAELLPGRDMTLAITAALMMALLLLFTKVKAMPARPDGTPAEVSATGLIALFAASVWLGFIVLGGNTGPVAVANRDHRSFGAR